MGLEGVQIIMETEKRFGVEITDPEAEALRVVEDLHLLVMAKLGAGAPEPGAVWERIRDIIVEETGIRREEIRPGSRWPEVGVR